jgi:tetratricopeptide (TPR) repeat protein
LIELLAGDPAAAAELAEAGAELSAAPARAQAYYRLGRLEDAEAWAGRAAEIGASDDWMAQMPSLQVRAKVLARRGEHSEAERLAREAVAIGARAAQALNLTADAYADLAEVLSLAGRTVEAASALEQALDRYERKENVVMAARIRARLEALREGAATAVPA